MVVDDSQDFQIAVSGSQPTDSLLEFFDGWSTAQVFFGDTHVALQTFSILTTVELGLSGFHSYEITRIKLRGYASVPVGIPPVTVSVYQRFCPSGPTSCTDPPGWPPISPLDVPLGTATIDTVPSSSIYQGDWMEAIFPSGLIVTEDSDMNHYTLMVHAPNAILENQLRLNIDPSNYLYPSGNLHILDLTTNITNVYPGRCIAFQIFGVLLG